GVVTPRGQDERQARVQRIPAGRGAHQRDGRGEQLGDELRQSRPQYQRGPRRYRALRWTCEPGRRRQLLRHGDGRRHLGRPGLCRRLHVEQGLSVGPGLRVERWLHVEQGIYVEQGLHVEQELRVELGLHVEQRLHVEQGRAVVERASLGRLGRIPRFDRFLRSE